MQMEQRRMFRRMLYSMHRSLLFPTWQRMIVATCADCRYRVCRSTHFPVEHEEGKKRVNPQKKFRKKREEKKKNLQDRPARDKQGHRRASSREHLPRPASIISSGKGKQSRQLKEGQIRRKQGKGRQTSISSTLAACW